MALLDAFKKEDKKGKAAIKPERVQTAVKPKQKSAAVRAAEAPAAGKKGARAARFADVILSPRITEKASFITTDGGYTFNVAKRANKIQIKRAIKELYDVTPIKVSVIAIPSKRVMVRGRRGVKSGGKKAVVYLKKGERIEFV